MATRTLSRALLYFNYNRDKLCHLNKLFINNNQLIYQLIPNYNNINSKNNYSDTVEFDEPNSAKKKKLFVPRVTLLSENDDMSVVTLDEAQKIAKRRNYKLIKIIDFDTKSQRPIYKLMKINEFINEQTKNKVTDKVSKDDAIKDEKSISISSKISTNDLNTKIKSINKMLCKRHGVRAVITVDVSKDKAMEIVDYIITETRDNGKVMSKNISGTNAKIILRPIINSNDKEKDENSNLSID